MEIAPWKFNPPPQKKKNLHTVDCNGRLDFRSILSLFFKFLAQLEFDSGSLEHRACGHRILIAIEGQLHHWN